MAVEESFAYFSIYTSSMHVCKIDYEIGTTPKISYLLPPEGIQTV